jgi:integrating conjugative element membrane protein (TIGR03747 family)
MKFDVSGWLIMGLTMPEQRKLTGIFWHLKWFVIIALLVLIIDLFCVFVLWSPEGISQLEQTLHQELAILGLSQSNVDFLAGVATSLYNTVFVSTGIDGMMRHAATLPPSSTRNSTEIEFVETLRPAIETAMLGLQLFALRLGVILLTLPLFAIVFLTAVSDGFLSWYLRRTGGERESGFIYHRAKRGLAWSIVGLWVVYLLPPIAMDPRYILPPFLLIAGIATRLQISFFKKFL